MGVKVTTEEMRRRLERGAGMENGKPIPHHVEVERAEEAFARGDDFIVEQGNRPLAEDCYLQEVAEKDDREDGRYLTQVLESLEFEIGTLMLTRGVTQRELAMCLAKVQEAKHWAIADGVRQNSTVIIDRRIFKVRQEEQS